MNWVHIIGGRDFSLADILEMEFDNAKKISPAGDMITVTYEDGYAVFEAVEKSEILREHEPEDIAVLDTLPFTPESWVTLTYSDISVLKRILADEYFPQYVFIDCDGCDLGLKDVFPKERLIFTEKPKR